MKRVLTAVLVLAALPSTAQAQRVTVYSSLPLSGAARTSARAVNDGARLALQQAGGMAGGLPVRLVTFNDGNRRGWTPEHAAANALAAENDRTTAAYIGEFNSSATEISL